MFITKKRHDAEVRAISASHDHWQDQARGWEAKYKLALRDIAAQSDQLTDLNRKLINQGASIANLMPDAKAWRDRKAKAAAYEKNRRVRKPRAKRAVK